jgi:hypothetical protein
MPQFQSTLLAVLEAAKTSCNELMRAIASLKDTGEFFEPFHDRTDS